MLQTVRSAQLINSLRAVLMVEPATITRLEQKYKKLGGKVLKAERSRRTEMNVFVRCYTLYYGDQISGLELPLQCAGAVGFSKLHATKLKKAENALGPMIDVPRADYRVYEAQEFTSVLRTVRTNQGVLPSYVKMAYQNMVLGEVWDYYKSEGEL